MTEVKRISEEVNARRRKWIGHVLRMEDNCYCMTAMSWVPEGRRKVGAPTNNMEAHSREGTERIRMAVLEPS